MFVGAAYQDFARQFFFRDHVFQTNHQQTVDHIGGTHHHGFGQCELVAEIARGNAFVQVFATAGVFDFANDTEFAALGSDLDIFLLKARYRDFDQVIVLALFNDVVGRVCLRPAGRVTGLELLESVDQALEAD